MAAGSFVVDCAATVTHAAERLGVKDKAELMMDKKELKGGYRSLSTAEYRRVLQAHGLIEPDQHVCHIIATANGGADHPDNYHVFSQAYNSSTKHLHDDLTCFLVGENKANAAVEVSRRYGNKHGKKYEGPDAATLVANGDRKHKSMSV